MPPPVFPQRLSRMCTRTRFPIWMAGTAVGLRRDSEEAKAIFREVLCLCSVCGCRSTALCISLPCSLSPWKPRYRPDLPFLLFRSSSEGKEEEGMVGDVMLSGCAIFCGCRQEVRSGLHPSFAWILDGAGGAEVALRRARGSAGTGVASVSSGSFHLPRPTSVRLPSRSKPEGSAGQL